MINLFYLKDGLKLSTARLNVRFRKSIPVEKIFTIETVAQQNFRTFYKSKSRILIDEVVFAEAEGYFKNNY